MPPSPQVTPFIPPLPEPEGSSPIRPPVVPSPGRPYQNPPAWANYPATPAQYPAYPGTPYTGTPYVPPMSGLATPAAPPGSYFPPPVNLPGGPPVQNAHGYSSDYTGYPNLGGATAARTPWGPPPSTLPGNAPFLHPSAAAFATPYQQPAAFGPSMGHPAMGPPPGMGHPGMGHPGMGHPGMGHPGMGGPMPGMGGGGWGPSMGGPTPYGPPVGAFPAWAQTPGWAAQQPPLAPDSFDTGGGRLASTWSGAREKIWDNIDHFAEGPDYGAVLEPFLARVVGANIILNPLLEPAPEAEDRDHLVWDMLFPSSHCRRSAGDPRNRSWTKGRTAPATFPRMTSLRIVSRAFPWMITIRAGSRSVGVTCGEVIDGLDDYMHTFVSKQELKAAPATQQQLMSRAYHFNRSAGNDVPGGRLGEGMKRCDWLCNHTIFGGVLRNERFVREHCGDVLPCTFELRCMTRYQLTSAEEADLAHREEEEERREAAESARPRSRTSRRTRSRATSSAGRSSTETGSTTNTSTAT